MAVMSTIAIQSRGELQRVLLLGLLVLGIVLAAGLGALAFAASAVDQAVATEERELATRTLARREAQLVDDLVSATVWDDAYIRTVLAFDAAWVNENYGVYYATYMSHDRTLVFSPEGQVVYASEAGEAVPPASMATFAGHVAPVVAGLQREAALRRGSDAEAQIGLKGATTASGIIRSGEETWILGLSSVTPETGKVTLTGGPSAFVVSGRRIDGPFLAELQSDLGVKDLRLRGPDETSRGLALPLTNARGEVIGLLTWTPKRPGAGILGDALGPILLVFAAFAVAAGALARRVRAALGTLATNDARLEAALDDLTEARDRAEAASVAKSQFLANISHEIRTPLNGVLGMAQIMERGELAPNQRRHLAIIRESGATLLTLLNDVLDLAKIEAGKLEIQRDDADLGTVVSGVCATFMAMAQEKSLRLGFVVEPSAAGVWRMDSMRVRQVLANLISNAIKFTDRGHVSVRVWSSLRGIEFAVLDTGGGIPADRLADLFGKFNQLDASTTRQFGGTGLGLAICRELVELMGGEMAVESTVGQGSHFSFFLPAERGRDRAAA
jgi:signal transduction histidine kinase